ncbi:MAG: class I SAM-dependent DNA methyltransferase [Paracoccaceae bacterium]
MEKKRFLEGAYSLDGAEATREFYDAWSKSYDEEIRESGYASPARCAAALRRFAADRSAPLLDIGCGTGVSGEAFRAAGFMTIDGTDFSADMLAVAQGKKGLYRKLTKTDVTDPFPIATGEYANIAAVGVLSPGHAPAETLDTVMSLLNPGGNFVFSLNDHALEDGRYEDRIREHVDAGSSVLAFREYGEHLPKIGLKATVYVLRRQ